METVGGRGFRGLRKVSKNFLEKRGSNPPFAPIRSEDGMSQICHKGSDRLSHCPCATLFNIYRILTTFCVTTPSISMK